MAGKPLAGIRLVDLTHMLSGAYAGMIFADLGCDTVKPARNAAGALQQAAKAPCSA